MLTKSFRFALLLSIWMVLPRVAAQPSTDVILFVWEDVLRAQSLSGGELLNLPVQSLDSALMMPTGYGNGFDYAGSPLTTPPIDNYGFYQGVRAANGETFAYLAIQPGDAGYHVVLFENDAHRIVFSDVVGLGRGYLVPVGWADDGSLTLLERNMLHNLSGDVRLWRYSEGDAFPVLRHTVRVPDLKGNSASLGAGRVFVGFDTVGQRGYVIDINTAELTTFATSFALVDPPPSVFETYPVQVVGVATLDAFNSWLAEAASVEVTLGLDEDVPLTEPFLHWPLPDDTRGITCYPDSEWTDMLFPVECPGLALPRNYEGHEGTDVGGRPNGLEIGTPVYAASPGMVVEQVVTCPRNDINCSGGYGNYVLMEHVRVVDHDVNTWFTGYAHLETVLVETNTYINRIGVPIALSGTSGFGGPHLHFEVRSSHAVAPSNWVDPWDNRYTQGDSGLWIFEEEQPLSSVVAAPPPILLTCQTIDGNNIRKGPSTEFEIITQTTAQTIYEVFQVHRVESGGTPGDWYHIRWPGGASTGWLWSNLMTDCATVQ